MVGAYHFAFVFQHPERVTERRPAGVMVKHRGGEMVFKTGLRPLRRQRPTKRRAAVMRQPFQVNAGRQRFHQLRFAAAGTPADKHHRQTA